MSTRTKLRKPPTPMSSPRAVHPAARPLVAKGELAATGDRYLKFDGAPDSDEKREATAAWEKGVRSEGAVIHGGWSWYWCCAAESVFRHPAGGKRSVRPARYSGHEPRPIPHRLYAPEACGEVAW